MPAVMETIGARLKRLRLERHMSSIEVGKRIRMSDNYIRQVERSEHAPGFGMAADLAKLYGVSLDYIAGLTEHESNPYVRRLAPPHSGDLL